MPIHQFETPEGHAYEVEAPDHVTPDEVHAIASGLLGAHLTPVSSGSSPPDPAAPPPAREQAATPAPEASPPPGPIRARPGHRLPLPPPLAKPDKMLRPRHVSFDDPHLPEPDHPDQWPNSLTTAQEGTKEQRDKLHGPPPNLLADPAPLHRPQYGDTTGLSTLPGTWFPNQGIRRPLLEMPVEARKRLRFDDPQLDAYARVVEVRHKLTPELLVSIKNRGERTDSWQNGGQGSVGVMQLIKRNQNVYNLPGENPQDPVASIDGEGRFFAKDIAARNDFHTVRGQVAAHNGSRPEGHLVEDRTTVPSMLDLGNPSKNLPRLNSTTRNFMERVLDDLTWKKRHETDQHLYSVVLPDPPKLYDPVRVIYRLDATPLGKK